MLERSGSLENALDETLLYGETDIRGKMLERHFKVICVAGKLNDTASPDCGSEAFADAFGVKHTERIKALVDECEGWLLVRVEYLTNNVGRIVAVGMIAGVILQNEQRNIVCDYGKKCLKSAR